MNKIFLQRSAKCLNARQPGTVLNRLNARQSENFTEFSLKASSKLLKIIKCFFLGSLDTSKDTSNPFHTFH